jgi:hypothetical protein
MKFKTTVDSMEGGVSRRGAGGFAIHGSFSIVILFALYRYPGTPVPYTGSTIPLASGATMPIPLLAELRRLPYGRTYVRSTSTGGRLPD